MPYINPDDKRAYQRRWYANNKKRLRKEIAQRKEGRKKKARIFVDRYKLDVGCHDCGFNSEPSALDFDHLADKKHNISNMVNGGYAVKTISVEMRKCDVVCSNCHRVRTKKRRES